MNEGYKILFNSLSVFFTLSIFFLGFGFFIYPNLNFVEKGEVLPASEVLSIVDQQEPYAFNCPETFQVLNVPKDYSTIKDAINSTNGGVIIKVAPGVYNENIKMKPNMCLIGEEFGKVKILGFSGTVIEASDRNRIENLQITSLGRANIGILITGAEMFSVKVNSFNNLKYGISVKDNSKINIDSNVFVDVDYGLKIEKGNFWIGANNMETTNIAFDIFDSEGDFVGQVIRGGDYGVKSENSKIFFDKNIFSQQRIASVQLCSRGDYEIGDNFFRDTNAEILY